MPIAPDHTDAYAHERAMIAEIRLLFDYAGGNSKQSIVDLKVSRIDPPAGFLTPGAAPPPAPRDGFFTTQECLERLDSIERKLRVDGAAPNPPSGDITGTDKAFLHLLRDGLNTLVQPATGMTVAYTAMTTTTEGTWQAPRLNLAEHAYPALRHLARRHRFCSYVFLALALFATSFAVWEATKVALGKSLLASLQELRTQQSALNADMMRLEAKPDSATKWNYPTFPSHNYSLRACENASYRFYELDEPERAKLKSWAENRQKVEQAKSKALAKASDPRPYEILVFEAPTEREVCDRDVILASNFGLFYVGLREYRTNWPSLVGRSFQLAQAVGDGVMYIPRLLYEGLRRGLLWVAGGGPVEPPPAAILDTATGDDIEWIVVARLLVLGNYVLPVVFSLLGAIAYVMVDFFTKVRGSLLAPRDLSLAWVRLVLGLVVGACIGLLYSSATPSAQPPTTTPNVSALVSALSLSASGVAFLAGFGVEGVFSMLESVVRRVFPST
jgi:hypothetical protein